MRGQGLLQAVALALERGDGIRGIGGLGVGQHQLFDAAGSLAGRVGAQVQQRAL